MSKLTEDQINAAVEAMQKAHISKIVQPDAIPLTERLRAYVEAVTPHVQLPWDEPVSGEINAIFDSQNRAYSTLDVVQEFVRRRNATLLPKLVDPRRDQIAKIIFRNQWVDDSLTWEEVEKQDGVEKHRELADRILSALDEVKP